MANHKGSEGTVSVDANTVAELVGYSWEESSTTIDDTELGDEWMTKQAGTKSWTATIDALWDETDTTAQGAMTIGAEVTVLFLPEGNVSGDTSYTGSAIVTSKSNTVAKDAMTNAQFSLEGNGALTPGTVV